MGRKAPLPHDQPKKSKKERRAEEKAKKKAEAAERGDDAEDDDAVAEGGEAAAQGGAGASKLEPTIQELHNSEKRFHESRSVVNPKKKGTEGHLKLKIRALKDPQEPKNYLLLWKSTRKAWKFSKNIQNWLLTNMHDANKVDDATFENMVEYCADMKGGARAWAEEDCKHVQTLAADLDAQIAGAREDPGKLASLKREAGRMKLRKKRAARLLTALKS